ncbi:S8 family serine peptidase [Rheinheimera pacifica]|uniref:S8 family serine peptidase n=1 Tax=Rheinheimera pacifica TaxID=173990 RepID=UPI002EDB9B84
MFRNSLLALAGCGLLCAWAEAAPQPVRIILTLEPEVSASSFEPQLLSVQGVTKSKSQPLRRYQHLPQLAVATLASGADVDKAIAEYQNMPGVKAAELDHKVSKAVIPNDPRFAQQWHLGAGKGINAVAAWDQTTGDDELVVAVIDTGVDYLHPDLAGNIWQNPGETAGDGIDNDNNGYIDDVRGINPADDNVDPMDEDGHGTVIAGIISARTNNNVGVAGINWNVKILPCRFMDVNGDGFISDAIECLDYVLDLKLNHNVNIVASNNSWGAAINSQALYNAIAAHNDAGILFVASAGNENSQAKFYPAAFDLPNVISVTAHDEQGNKADFANYGRDWVSLSAPGVGIISTGLDDPNNPNDGYASASGTSMAAPMVAGVAALAKAAEPALTMQQLRGRLLVSGQAATDPLLAEQTINGNLLLASGSGQSGVLNCVNAQHQRRMLPVTDIVYLAANTAIDLKVLSINCDGNGVPVSITQGGNTINLVDNGVTPDINSGDGVYSTRWTFDGNNTSLVFPDGTVEVRLRNNDYCSVNNVSEIPLAECSALVDLYYDTAGQNWVNRTNWLQNNTPCNWYGVSCSAGHVVSVTLDDNRLVGTIPSSIASLTELQQLDLSFNTLQGSLQLALTQLTKLQSLILWHNAIEGTIPTQLSTLPALQILDLSENRFTGSIPAALGGLTTLQALYVDSNLLSGGVPSALGQLSQLRALWLSDNTLSGTLPQSLTALTLMQDFRFENTDLCPPTGQQFTSWLQQIETVVVNTDCGSSNTAPVVSAGTAQQVSSGATVQLRATATDSDADNLTYQWQQIGGPQVSLSNTTALNTSFTAPAVSAQTHLLFRFTANDGTVSSSAEVLVTVNPASSGGGGNDNGGGSGGGSFGIIWLLLLTMIYRSRLGKAE